MPKSCRFVCEGEHPKQKRSRPGIAAPERPLTTNPEKEGQWLPSVYLTPIPHDSPEQLIERAYRYADKAAKAEGLDREALISLSLQFWRLGMQARHRKRVLIPITPCAKVG